MSTGPLDPRFDPDRYDPDRDGRDRAPEPPPELPRGLDPRNDPDRFDNKNLVELIGKDATYEDERDGAAWLFGLLGVFAFLALVAFLFQYVLSP